MIDELVIEEMSIRATQEKWTERFALRCREQSTRAKKTSQLLSRRNQALEIRRWFCLNVHRALANWQGSAKSLGSGGMTKIFRRAGTTAAGLSFAVWRTGMTKARGNS